MRDLNLYKSIHSAIQWLRIKAPDIFKYFELFSCGDIKCYLRKDDYGYFYIHTSEEELLKLYATNNDLDFNELILYFRMGYLEGKINFHERMKYEFSTYQFDGIKNYLLKIITGGNYGQFPSYSRLSVENGIPSKIYPKQIQDSGYKNAEFCEACIELFEKHLLFNDFFKEINIKEYKKNSNNSYSQMFPKRYFKNSYAPDSVQCATDLYRNCYTLIDVLKNKNIPFKDEEGKVQNLHFIIKPDNIRQFYNLTRDFLKEAANNHEKGLVEINKEYYKSVIHRVEECIEILQDPMFLNCDMSSFDGFENTKGNWFIDISDCLIIYVDSFKKKYDFIFNLESIESQTDSEVSIQKEEINKEKETFLPSKFLQFFQEGAYELFCYLETEYVIDDKTKKTKYSNIFHFLNYHSLLICTQDQYIEFIDKEKGIKMSKVFPKNFKYKEDIFPLLGRLKSDFEKSNKNETK